MAELRWWAVELLGFESSTCIVRTMKRGGAKYALFLAMRDAGYFLGAGGFERFLAHGIRIKPATEIQIANAPRIGR